MKDYHFEREDRNLDETIRLDDINEKLKELESEPDDELGDKNEFLNAFESERFDEPPEPAEDPDEPEPDGEIFETQETPRPSRHMDNGNRDDDADKPDRTKKLIGLATAAAVVTCILFFFLAKGGFRSPVEPEPQEMDAVPMLVEGLLDGDELVVYDIKADRSKTITLSEDTVLTDAQGRNIAYGSLPLEGDLLMVKLDSTGEHALSMDYGNGIHSQEITGLTVDAAKRTLSGEDESFEYGKKAKFFYKGEEISPKDLEPCDILRLKGVEDLVWSVEVLEYHGYIVVEHRENIKNGKFRLDEEEEIPLEEIERIAVSEGTHTITVTGDNIETRTDNIFVETGEEYLCDLSKAQEKVGVILINANVSDYKLYINGTLVDSSSPAVLPLGEYDLVILKNGYLEWNSHVTLNQATLTVNAELQKEIQYGTLTVTADCDGATVYINNEETGIAPMQINLPYGIYNVRVEKDGYDTYEQAIAINGPAAHVSAVLE